jgi:hypothetical protein
VGGDGRERHCGAARRELAAAVAAVALAIEVVQLGAVVVLALAALDVNHPDHDRLS